MSYNGAREHITAMVTSWDGVSAQPHRFGGTEYRIGKREIGHIHGVHMLDIPFPTRVRQEIVDAGQTAAHHLLPESGWVSFYLHEAADLAQAVELLRRSYQLAVEQKRKRGNFT
jgi:hypothetical protein